MSTDPGKYSHLAHDETDSFKQGIDKQRDAYKEASLNNDYERMARALENLYCEVLPKTNPERPEKIEAIKETLDWFYTLRLKYMKKTEMGMKAKFPMDIDVKIRTRFRDAYTSITRQLVSLRLL